MEYDDTHMTAVCLQGVICLQRKVATKDHKLVYFFAGATAALSALIEKKSRRSELALYTLPRAGDSLWHILVNRNLIPNIKHAEVSLFCLICQELERVCCASRMVPRCSLTRLVRKK